MLAQPKELRACSSTEFMSYVPKNPSSVSLKYFTQYFLSNLFQRRLELVATGSTNSHVRVGPTETTRWKIKVPPLPEQKKIASILTSVDDVIENTQKQIDKLQDLKKATMNELLTKGIGHTEFKDSELGRIPKSWEVKSVSEICTDIIDCVNKTAPVVEHPTPYKMIRTTNVRYGEIDTDNVRYVSEETFQIWTRRGVLQENDIIFTREAPVGETGLVDEPNGLFLGQRTMLYRADPSQTNPHFLLFAFQSEYCKKQLEDMTGGSTVGHMRVPDCSKIKFLHCSKDEQDHIASSISSINNNILSLKRRLSQTQSLKKALMQDLLTGKVRVQVN
jgi:type I restriction enzyme S subunit